MTSTAYNAESRGARAIRWAAAAILVIGVHAWGVFALLRPLEDDSPDASGAIAIELSAVVAAPAFKSEDVAPGPLMQEEAPTPETPKQTKETVAEEVPRAEPSPLAPEPAVKLPEPQLKKDEKPEEEKTTPEQASRQALADPVTTAPPPSEAKPADTVVAPAPGLSALVARAQASWHKSLLAHINRHKRYPLAARAHRMEGEVRIEFALDRRGNVLASRIAKSSGSSLFDEEALAVLQRAAPLPAPPEQLPTDKLLLVLPIQFEFRMR